MIATAATTVGSGPVPDHTCTSSCPTCAYLFLPNRIVVLVGDATTGVEILDLSPWGRYERELDLDHMLRSFDREAKREDRPWLRFVEGRKGAGPRPTRQRAPQSHRRACY